jgi:hypothetical protein
MLIIAVTICGAKPCAQHVALGLLAWPAARLVVATSLPW